MAECPGRFDSMIFAGRRFISPSCLWASVGKDKEMKRIAILGSTFSIGTPDFGCSRANGDIEVVGIAAEETSVHWKARFVNSPRSLCVWDEEKAKSWLSVWRRYRHEDRLRHGRTFWRLRSWKDMRSS